jgi:hypothetical protein
MAKLKTSYLTKIHETRTTDVEGLGTIREETDAVTGTQKVYKWVRYDAAAVVTIAAGQVLGYVDRGGNTVTNDFSAALDSVPARLMAGVLQLKTTAGGYEAATVLPAINEYFWMQIGGVSDPIALIIAGTTPAVGDQVVFGSDSTATKASLLVTDALGFAHVEAVGGAGVNTLNLNCPE